MKNLLLILLLPMFTFAQIDKSQKIDSVQNKIVNGVFYSPRLVNGKIAYKKNNRLTRLAKQQARYKRQGLNEWGININAKTWHQALRAHIGAKAVTVSSEGLPIFFPITTLNNGQLGPLWVIDGIYMDRPPAVSSCLLYTSDAADE